MTTKTTLSRIDVPNFDVGDHIHVHSIEGQYIVIRTDPHYFTITCKKWQVQKMRGQRETDFLMLPYDDYKCKVGIHGRTKKEIHDAIKESVKEIFEESFMYYPGK